MNDRYCTTGLKKKHIIVAVVLNYFLFEKNLLYRNQFERRQKDTKKFKYCFTAFQTVLNPTRGG